MILGLLGSVGRTASIYLNLAVDTAMNSSYEFVSISKARRYIIPNGHNSIPELIYLVTSNTISK